MRFTDNLWRYTLAIAGGLVLAWLLSARANAETVAICFTDPRTCAPCRVLEQSWRLAEPSMTRIVRNVHQVERSELEAWGVTCWPDTVLVEMDGGKVTKIYRRHVGAMTVSQLRDFLKVVK